MFNRNEYLGGIIVVWNKADNNRTRAERGATVYFQENQTIKNKFTQSIKVNVINKIGCGDVFGAVYFYNYIKNKNVTLALEQANLLAGIATSLYSIEELLNLKQYANEWIGKKYL